MSNSCVKSRMFGSLIGLPGRSRVGRERVGRLAGDRGERRLRRQPVRLPQVVVGRHAVVAAALDVDRAEVDHAGEALGQGRAVEARAVLPGTGHLEQHAAELVVDHLVVVVLATRPRGRQHRAEADAASSRSGLKKARLSGTTSSSSSPSTVTSTPCASNAVQLRRRSTSPASAVHLELAVDLAVRPVADRRELVRQASGPRWACSRCTRAGCTPSAGGTPCR